MLPKLHRIILFFALVATLSGCSSVIGRTELQGQINVIQQQIIAKEWDSLAVQLDRLMAVYKQNEWKLQLLGDEDEYESLHESISRLQAAVDLRDEQAARLELATIRSILEDIYSL